MNLSCNHKNTMCVRMNPSTPKGYCVTGLVSDVTNSLSDLEDVSSWESH